MSTEVDPVSAVGTPSGLFAGSIPAVHFAAVTPLQSAVIGAVHGPEFHPIYEAGQLHPHTQPGLIHAVVGTRIDRRG